MFKKYLRIVLIAAACFVTLFYVVGGGFGRTKPTSELLDISVQFAHRGMINFGEENTIAGFLLAQSNRYNGIETDISATKDHQLILFHDPNCMRLLSTDTPISALNYLDLQKLPRLKNAQQTPNEIPLLKKVIQQFDDTMFWYLDIKNPSKQVADSLAPIILKHGNPKRIVVANSNIFFLAYLKWKNPKIQTVLEGFNAGKEWTYFLIPRNWKPDFYASFLNQVNPKHVNWLTKNHLLKQKIVYGVTTENLKQTENYGIDKVIIDAVLLEEK